MKHLKLFENFDMSDWQNRWDQLVMDMEEEAEAEGGPIANQYAADMEELEREKEEGGGNLIGGPDASYPSGITNSDNINKLYSQLEPYLNNNQLQNIIGHLKDDRDDVFINTRLSFYGVNEEDQPMVLGMINTLKEILD